jgi:hypothetical protein
LLFPPRNFLDFDAKSKTTVKFSDKKPLEASLKSTFGINHVFPGRPKLTQIRLRNTVSPEGLSWPRFKVGRGRPFSIINCHFILSLGHG